MTDDRVVLKATPLVWPRDPLGRIGRYMLESMFRRSLPGWHCPNPSCRAFNGAAKEWLIHCRCCGTEAP